MKDPEIATEFAALLRAARGRAGISQEALAARAGLDRSAVGQLERAVTAPRLSTAMRLASALGIDPCELIPAMRLRMTGGGAPVFEWARE